MHISVPRVAEHWFRPKVGNICQIGQCMLSVHVPCSGTRKQIRENIFNVHRVLQLRSVDVLHQSFVCRLHAGAYVIRTTPNPPSSA